MIVRRKNKLSGLYNKMARVMGLEKQLYGPNFTKSNSLQSAEFIGMRGEVEQVRELRKYAEEGNLEIVLYSEDSSLIILPYIHLQVLRAVYEIGKSTVEQISEKAKLSEPTLSNCLHDLEDAGYISKSDDNLMIINEKLPKEYKKLLEKNKL